MTSVVLAVLAAFQAAFSGFNLYLAYISISNLQEYEEISEKAAKYSNLAERQLHKTRTTQASGTVAVSVNLPSSNDYDPDVRQILLSFLTSIYLVFSSPSILNRFLAIGGNAAALLAASQHVGAFWRRKAKIPLPGVGDYNEAISKTHQVRLNMVYMAAGWVGLGILSIFL